MPRRDEPRTFAEVESDILWEEIKADRIADVAIVQTGARSYALGVLSVARGNWARLRGNLPATREYPTVKMVSGNMSYAAAMSALALIQSEYGYRLDLAEQAPSIAYSPASGLAGPRCGGGKGARRTRGG